MSLSKPLAPQTSSPKLNPPIHYIANLRTTLTTLVILHHTATTYGGIGRNTYQSSLHPQASSLALSSFNAFNQSFFMGTYFYMAGHFSRRALVRKGRKEFMRERVRRLLVPTVLYTVFGGGFAAGWERWWFRRGPIGINWFVREWVGKLQGIRGPVWFLGTLLVFDSVLAITFPPLAPKPADKTIEEDSKPDEPISTPKLLSALGLTSIAEFGIRAIYPIGTIMQPLKLNLGYLGQYVATYTFGALAQTLSTAIPSPNATLTLLGLSLSSTAFLIRSMRSSPAPLSEAKGGLTLPALSYAIWGNITGYLIGSTMLAAFKKYLNKPWGKTVNEVAFPAFLVHMPVLTVLGTFTDGWEVDGVLKTVVIGTGTAVGSWVVGGVGSSAWNAVGRAVVRAEGKGKGR